MEKRLTHPDYREICPDGTVRYTREGLRFYTEACRVTGYPLPLPGDKDSYDAMIWHLLDVAAETVAGQFRADLADPSLPVREVARGYLAGTPDSSTAARQVSEAVADKEQQAKAGVLSLAWARMRKR